MMMTRRDFLGTSALTAAGLRSPRAFATVDSRPPLAKVEHCIVLWMGGGMCHLDTFDPKRRGDPKTKKAGSDYAAIDTIVPGVQVCEHLPQTAKLMDRMTAVRSVTHNTIDEHATATYFVHTGRLVSETIRYPSLGSLVVHEKPAPADVPGYVVIGIPNVSRGPGFLGPKAGYLNVTETNQGPAGFAQAEDVTAARQERRDALLGVVRAKPTDAAVAAQEDAAAAFRKLAGPSFLKLFDLRNEPAALRQSYGADFGQRCLLARRLIGAGTRFVEVSFHLQFVNGAGWDTHKEVQEKQHLLVKDLDAAYSTLLRDLEQQKLLDKTLVVIATEFGRPPEFDAGGGRGHQSKGFTMVLAGGGLAHRGAFGATDDLGKSIVVKPVTVPDFHATICAAMGIDPHKELFDGSRPVPLTDGGKPIAELLNG